MKFLIVILTLLCLGACGASEQSGTSSSSKSIFSVWTETTSGIVIDLSLGQFGVNQSMTWLMSDGALCSCDFSLIGSESSGNYVFSSCSYINGTGGGDPGCGALNTNGNYTNDGTNLIACDSSCAAFK